MKNCIKLSMLIFSLLCIRGIAAEDEINEPIDKNELHESVQNQEIYNKFYDMMKQVKETYAMQKERMKLFLENIEKKTEEDRKVLGFAFRVTNHIIYNFVQDRACEVKVKFKQLMNLKIDDKNNVIPCICS